MEPLPLPSSLEEVVTLIQALYEPNPPETISRIQDVLHRLQRSPQGWQLARDLISTPNDNVKFFAALTLIIKLNRDSSGLGEDDAKELLENLIAWFLQSLLDGSGSMVSQKLCTALVTYFIHFSKLWPRCARHLVYCLDIGRCTSPDAVDDALQPSALVGNLSPKKLQAAIWFATSFVEEVGKTDLTSPKYIDVHQRLMQNAAEIACIIGHGLSPNNNDSVPLIQKEAINCYQAWILYAQRASSNLDILVSPLRSLVEPAMTCFANEELFEATCELFTDVLSNYSGFFTTQQYEALSNLFSTPWAQDRYLRVIQGNHDEDGINFGLLMLAYGDARVVDLMEDTDDRPQRFLASLSGLLAANGYPVAEDHIFVPALEFWSTFAETMVDSAFSAEGDPQPWRPYAARHLQTVVMNCWRKLQWPQVEEIASWDSADRLSFVDARKDVADLLQSVYALNGRALVSFFTELLLQHMPTQAWTELEASAFCLEALSDCFSEDSECDFELSKVFSAPFFELLGQAHGPIPLRLRQTGLSLIERYSEYFERHAEYLPHALNLLFGAVGDSVLGGPSAKSISILCSSCRSILTGEVATFVNHYRTIHSTQAIDSLAEERIVLAVSSIIQAIPNEEQRLAYFEQLYTIVKKDFEQASRLKTHPETLDLTDPAMLRGIDPSSSQPASSVEEISQQLGLRSLRCLASIAKGMQDIKEHAVDLDNESPTLVRSERLVAIQDHIMSFMVSAQRTFNTSGEVVEAVCNILRAGFSETEPGPFVFPPDLVVDFFVNQPFTSPRLGAVLSTACSFVGSIFRGPKAFLPTYLAKLLPWVISLLHALPGPESDVEITQNGIIFVDRVMSKHPELVFQLQTELLEFFFMFSLSVLNGKEPLPKNAAADFWTNFITLKNLDPNVQATIGNAMQTLGPLIAESLMQNIGGNAARSELDKLSDPLKKLVIEQVHAQSWLEQALNSDSFPSSQVSREDKSIFLKKIIGLRGSRPTNQVVRDFWLACRGSNFAYAS